MGTGAILSWKTDLSDESLRLVRSGFSADGRAGAGLGTVSVWTVWMAVVPCAAVKLYFALLRQLRSQVPVL